MAVTAALRARVHPRVPEYGAVGTGDLTALAELGLALFGHGTWIPDRADAGHRLPASLPVHRGDALALLSSSALTLGQSALACHDLGVLLSAAHVVAALSLLAVDASMEPYAPGVHAAHPHPAVQGAAARVRDLLGTDEVPLAGPPESPVGTSRVQDPYGFRCFPQAHGPATEAWESLERVLSIDLNSATENPLIGWDATTRAPVALHHGGFFTAPLTLALDQLGLAVLGTARLSAARLSGLGRPELTGLRSYLADTSSAGSGMMILEYSAASALAEIQLCATPAALGHVVLSQGMEEAATFATQAARTSLRLARAYRLVLGCELVAAVRALRLRGRVPRPETASGPGLRPRGRRAGPRDAGPSPHGRRDHRGGPARRVRRTPRRPLRVVRSPLRRLAPGHGESGPATHPADTATRGPVSRHDPRRVPGGRSGPRHDAPPGGRAAARSRVSSARPERRPPSASAPVPGRPNRRRHAGCPPRHAGPGSGSCAGPGRGARPVRRPGRGGRAA